MNAFRVAKSCWLAKPGTAEIREQTLPALGPGEARVRTLYTAISRGTERLVYGGRVPESEYSRMRAPFQEGEFPGPVKYGYINVGIVEAGPDALLGKTVFCLYPHQDLYQVAASALTVVPQGVPAKRAVLAAGMETALNALWDAEIKIGDRVVVIGAGAIGALVAYLARGVIGTEVTLVDVDTEKADLADALGLRFETSCEGIGAADVVVHASGSEAGLRTALDVAGQEARIIEVSWYGDTSVRVPLGQSFHAKRLHIQSSQVGQLPASQLARWSYARRLRCALALLVDPTLDALISGECDFDALPSALAEIFSPAGNAVCHRVRYPGPLSEES